MIKTKPRLGIIITPNIEYEHEIKDEKWEIDLQKRPWLKNIEPRYALNEHTTSDVSIAYYLKSKYSHMFDVVLIRGDEVSVKALCDNDLNLTFIYDVSAAYAESNMYIFNKYTTVLSACKNYFPGESITKLLSDKPAYYTYLKKRGIRVNDFFYIESAKYMKDPYGSFRKIKDYLSTNNITKYIIKPKYGSCASGLSVFTTKSTDAYVMNAIEMLSRQYPGVIVMKYIEGYTSTGEYKVNFVLGKPYIVFKIIFADEESGETEAKLEAIDVNDPRVVDIVKYAETTYSILPKPNINGVEMPHLLIRIDITCCLDNKCTSDINDYFVSEIETMPSPLTDREYADGHSKMDVDIAEATSQLFLSYLQQRKPKYAIEWIIPAIIVILLIITVYLTRQRLSLKNARKHFFSANGTKL